MVVDFEITLNRFGFRRVEKNKIQFAFLRVSWWDVPGKHALSFEINWRRRETKRTRRRILRFLGDHD